MTIHLTAGAFQTALQSVVPVIATTGKLAILSHVRLSCAEGRITLTGTDLNTEISDKIILSELNELAIDCTIPAKKINDLVKSFPDDTNVAITRTEDGLTIKAGRGRYRLASLPVDDYPEFGHEDPTASFELPVRLLSETLPRVAFAMASQDVRYYLNGLHLVIRPDGLTLTATNGHRLAQVHVEDSIDIHENCEAIIPSSLIAILPRLLKDRTDSLQIGLTRRAISLRAGHLIIKSKLVDGKFPDISRMIPEDHPHRIIFDRKTLLGILRRLDVLSSDKYNSCLVELTPGKAEWATKNTESEEAREAVDIEYTGDAIRVGFNLMYLTEMLNAIPHDRIEANLQGSQSITVWRGEGQPNETYVIMPWI